MSIWNLEAHSKISFMVVENMEKTIVFKVHDLLWTGEDNLANNPFPGSGILSSFHAINLEEIH